MSHYYGIRLPNGSTITHGDGANIKHPFQDLPVEMHELDKGTHAFAGPLGFIQFTTAHRLPRRVHIAVSDDSTDRSKIHTPTFLHERIVVLEGVALVQLNDEIFVIPPRSLVTIAPGVPHTWTACPSGVTISGKGNGTRAVTSNGSFLMLYEYEAPTAFFPTKQTHTLKSVQDYERCGEDELDSIRIPLLTAEEVNGWCCFIWDREVTKPDRQGTRLPESGFD